jgi:hypothetical protein
VVEFAIGAHFDGVALDWLGSTFQFQEFGPRQWTGASSRQTGPKDVGHLHELAFLTKGAGFSGRTANVVGGAQEFRVGVTNVFRTQNPGGNLFEKGVTDEAKLHNGAGRRGCTQVLFHCHEL